MSYRLHGQMSLQDDIKPKSAPIWLHHICNCLRYDPAGVRHDCESSRSRAKYRCEPDGDNMVVVVNKVRICKKTKKKKTLSYYHKRSYIRVCPSRCTFYWHNGEISLLKDTTDKSCSLPIISITSFFF